MKTYDVVQELIGWVINHVLLVQQVEGEQRPLSNRVYHLHRKNRLKIYSKKIVYLLL
jgi:hypothetical protein